jgi:hypothetical protein
VLPKNFKKGFPVLQKKKGMRLISFLLLSFSSSSLCSVNKALVLHVIYKCSFSPGYDLPSRSLYEIIHIIKYFNSDKVQFVNFFKMKCFI